MITAAQKIVFQVHLGKTLYINIRYTCHNLLKLIKTRILTGPQTKPKFLSKEFTCSKISPNIQRASVYS